MKMGLFSYSREWCGQLCYLQCEVKSRMGLKRDTLHGYMKGIAKSSAAFDTVRTVNVLCYILYYLFLMSPCCQSNTVGPECVRN